MGDREALVLDVPIMELPESCDLKRIKWCEGHWAELMFALKDRGLDDQIAATAEELNAKFVNGDLDPCWEACNMINLGALEIFGPDKITEENAGCPVCAFANIVQHAGDLMHAKYGSTH